MKNITALLICLCMTFALAACSQEATPTQQPTTTQAPTTIVTVPETTAPEVTEPISTAVYTSPLACVSMPVITEAELSSALGNETIFYYTYPNISVILPDADVAEVVKLDLLNKIDVTRAAAQQIHDSAKNDYTAQENWYNYYMDVAYGVTRLDQNILSLYGTEASFDGTPNSSTIGVSANYDLSTGTSLTLKSIMFADYSADALVDMIIDGLKDYDTSALLPGYEDVIDQMFSTNIPMESWYFDNTGLCFYFAPYEIAPNSMGIIYSHVPYSALTGLMKEAYFPTEEFVYSGSVSISALDNSTTALEAYDQFGELTIGDGGTKYLLTANGSVLNLHIHELQNDNTAGKMLFAAAGIGPDIALLLDLPSDTTGLFITFESGGELIEMPVTDLSK